MEVLFALLFILIAIGIYFLPSIVAVNRNHRNRVPIILVNVFFGWSFIGWVIALIWSFTANQEPA